LASFHIHYLLLTTYDKLIP